MVCALRLAFAEDDKVQEALPELQTMDDVLELVVGCEERIIFILDQYNSLECTQPYGLYDQLKDGIKASVWRWLHLITASHFTIYCSSSNYWSARATL